MKRIDKMRYAVGLLLLTTQLTSHAQGPNAPEAASFEPVDATDMVNLVTGDFTYVLPLLNVPSPEGGYPIALAYHAGIAMDQEASWVGLGWSLNPGAINRGVNGYPDDWGKTVINEFFYDKGWEENYYRISAGVTLNGSLSVGLGLSWGSGQSLGGYVSLSIGLGEGESGGGIGIQIGTNGFGLNVRAAGFKASAGTNGVGLGYSVQKGGAEGLGFDLNYSPNSGLSGGVSFTEKTGTFKNGARKFSGVGISFSASGVSANGGGNGSGAGISSSISSVSGGDYDVNVRSLGFNFPLGIFYIGFNHTKIKYSLYKYNSLYVSGIAYPYFANEIKFPEEQALATAICENHFMDVNTISKFDGSMFFDELLDVTDQIDENNLMLPNYDNYILTAQGLSGSIKPISYQELNLSARGREVQTDEDSYGIYVNSNNKKSEVSYENTHETVVLGENLHFYFEDTYDSFLRNERSNIQVLSGYGGYVPSSIGNRYIFSEYLGTLSTGNYHDSRTYSFYANATKKRTGNSVVAYTNKQIRDSYAEEVSNLPGFIDATKQRYNSETEKNEENFLDRSAVEIFDDKGIGAYAVTAMDGKTYHYSLPVYNFETFYKNYKNEEDEYENFFEISKQKPYATHWLLTAVTGPDYVDINNNGRLDDQDYGYWVSFDYGKWSDGFGWKTSVEEINSNEKSDEINYSYAWGRKQIYYLDAVKTRTHTALFVKEVRESDTSFEIKINSGESWDPKELFSLEKNSKKFEKDKGVKINGNTYYTASGIAYSIPNTLSADVISGNNIYRCNGYTIEGNQTKYDYVDIPKNKTLKLQKILVVKNEDLQNSDVNKGTGDLSAFPTKGYMSFTNGIANVHAKRGLWPSGGAVCRGHVPSLSDLGYPSFDILYSTDPTNTDLSMKDFDIHLRDNVLDVEDIKNTTIDNKALQIIDFSYDYSLVTGAPNSEAQNEGRLTLKEVQFKGKEGTQAVPPYKFSYITGFSYDKDFENDWGYRTDSPHMWSLNNITTPTGGNIAIQYEKNEFKTAINNYLIFKNESDRFEALGPEINHTFFADPLTFDDGRKTCTINVKPEVITDAYSTGEEKSIELPIGEKLRLEYLGYLVNKKITKGWMPYYNVYQYKYEGYAEVISKNLNSYEVLFDGEIEYVDEIHNANWNKISEYLPKDFEKNKTISNKYVFEDENTPDISNVVYYNELWFELKLIKKIDYIRDSGGYRTKEIVVTGDSGAVLKTQYEYNDPATGETSGITSYAPFTLQQNVVPYVSELPAPRVMHSHVEMKNYDGDNKLLGSTVYEFETLEPLKEESGCLFSLGEAFKVKENQNETFEQGKIKASKYTIYNKLANIGRILSTKSYNNKGQVLTINSNQYKENLDEDGEVGVSQESYKSLKDIYNNDDHTNFYMIASTSKVNYPSVLESVTNTTGNFAITKHFNKYDFLTGQVLETSTHASDGVQFKTKTVPAYHVAAYSGSTTGNGMGSKVDHRDNKNMLIQGAANYTYLMDPITKEEKVISANLTTWNNRWDYLDHAGNSESTSLAGPDVWRKHKEYVWDGAIDAATGAYEGFVGEDDGFDWTVGVSQSSSSKWKAVSATTRYNHFSAPLEVQDINGNKAATIMGDQHSKIIATANAGYTEMFYSGGEYVAKDAEGNPTDYFDGAVGIGDGIPYNYYGAKHTGATPVTIRANEETFVVRPGKTGRYKASVWAYDNPEALTFPTKYAHLKLRVEGNLNAYTAEELVRAGDWVLLRFEAEINAGDKVSIVADGDFTATLDDFRLHPIAASMTSYVYNEWDELTYIMGPNGLATKYVYDAQGRLQETWQEVADTPPSDAYPDGMTGGFKIISQNEYHYKNR